MIIGELLPNGTVKIVRDEHSIARLGAGVDSTRMISREGIERAVAILKNYRNICGEMEVQAIRAVGTSALRDASNRGDVCEALADAIGQPIYVINGGLEARLSFSGATDGSGKPAMVIDIGGGSTEITAGCNNRIEFNTSINIGAVRLTERFFPELPASPANIDLCFKFILKKLPKEIPHYPMAVVAGTPATLASILLGGFSAKDVHGFRLTSEAVASLAQRLLCLPIDEIVKIPGVHAQRADILPTGALILKAVLELYKYDFCTVNLYGLRYGVLKDMLKK